MRAKVFGHDRPVVEIDSLLQSDPLVVEFTDEAESNKEVKQELDNRYQMLPALKEELGAQRMFSNQLLL